jgi:hypothetical protein
MVLSYFTIKDTIVKKALETLASDRYEDRSHTPIVVGGMATQLHCRDTPNRLRPTSDLDTMYLPQIADYEVFSNGIGKDISYELKRAQYQVQLKKIRNRPQYEVKIMDGQGNQAKELFFLHFDQRTPELAKKTSAINERESANAIEITYDGKPLYVVRIEDILSHKIKRVRKNITNSQEVASLEKAVFTNADRGKWQALANMSLEPWLQEIIDAQNKLPVNGALPKEYVINKDLYDLCLLARKIESSPELFNIAYFSNARQEIESYK